MVEMIIWNTSPQKCISTLHYILSNAGPLGPLELAKILYVSDKIHFSKHGRCIYGENYVAGFSSPIPKLVNSILCNDIHFLEERDKIIDFFSFKNNVLSLNKSAPDDYKALSVSDKSSLDDALLFVLTGDEFNYNYLVFDATYENTPIGKLLDASEMVPKSLINREELIEMLRQSAQYISF